ncbi:C4-dicarboxylate ABC transporter permease [Limnohabitans sp. Jir61]|uniref:TRAP transporter large permease n=1 Tax=Limnohabitans sp. Jir61 TaxID=1826168 RepID=UPI000D3601E1|nr:TRAP transporter large permease subunit [Limnohabitans sp. Jir61]PUE28748.1 C4-dicarboxylate ABC transporter permease [Limnohabitans sp. Jir61]
MGRFLKGLMQADTSLASLALVFMALIPLVEILSRPMMGKGIENAPVVVQHLGLLMAMAGAIAAERFGHLTSLGVLVPRFYAVGQYGAAVVCGVLTWASGQLVLSEMSAEQMLAYGMPVWWFEAAMPIGFACLAMKLGARCAQHIGVKLACAVTAPMLGMWLAFRFDGEALPLLPWVLVLALLLSFGAPIFAVLGGLALALFWQEGLPLASIALSHYQITVNPSLPALPLFTLAGLIFAGTGAAKRLGAVFVALFGGGKTGTVIAATVLCSCFTAFTGGSGVTILALGGLLLPLLQGVGYPDRKGISLVTSASALGVLLAPSVPLIMYAIIARVPINTMFMAGVVPAVVMVVCLLIFGGYLRHDKAEQVPQAKPSFSKTALRDAAWHAKWELLAPVVAIGSLGSGFATPTESAALTAIYAVATQAFAHRELDAKKLGECLSQCAQIIGGVMLILGMALGLTNYLVDAGIPDLATEWVQSVTQNKWVFLLALNVFLFAAGALMEIYAAIVVLVPLLLPLATSYGIDPVHFGIIFLANMEMGFLCPPAGMNIYFASAVFKQPIRTVAASVAPALVAIFVGTLLISWLPILATGLPSLVASFMR